MLIPPRFVRQGICALGFTTAAWAQAAVEYAARSAAGAVSATGGDFHVGACQVDRTLIACVSHLYPKAFQLVMLAICVFIGTVLMVRNRRL